MTQFLEIDTEGTSAALSKRAVNRVARSVNKSAAEKWDRQFLPLHFKRSASSRYGYKTRSQFTRKKKDALHSRGKIQGDGGDALVHSGLAKRTIATRHIVRGTPTKATVNMVTPSYFSLRSRKRINMAKEVLTISTTEEKQINDHSQTVNDRETKKEIANNRYRKRT